MKKTQLHTRRYLNTLLPLLLGLLIVTTTNKLWSTEAHLLRGVISDAELGHTLPGATIVHPESGQGTISGMEGDFEMRLGRGSQVLRITYVGYESMEVTVELPVTAVLEVALKPSERLLDEVLVQDRRTGDHTERTEMGSFRLPAQTIQQIPAVLGEVDLINTLQLLPGVVSAGEGSSGFNVRGGGIDQNLILMDEATVYNAAHLMGFFSIFNNDVVEDIQLYKGNMPARYGGRLASLLNVRMKEGNMSEFGGTGGIGSISSRLMLEGPLIEDRLSFVAAGRRSYADLFIPLADNPDIRGHKLYFYDLNLKLNAIIDENNRLQYSTYHGKDFFRMGQDLVFSMDWGNTTHSLRWNRILNSEWLLNTHLIYTGYNYSLSQTGDADNSFLWSAGNEDIGLRADFTWFPGENHQVSLGFSSVFHRFDPGLLTGLDEESFIGELGSTGSRALAHAIYAGNEQRINGRWSAEYGLRFTAFQSMGPATLYHFDDDFEPAGSTDYGRNEFFNAYAGLEPRLGLRYAFSDDQSLKASYNRNVQYLHLASYSDGGNPLDIWVPSSPNVKPQTGHQFALGYFRNLQAGERVVEASAEVFYKRMYNQIDFKENAWLMLNPRLEGEFRFGRARAYGAEFLFRKNEGNLTGWISYTWSRAMRRIDGVNGGHTYPAAYDRPHNLNVVMNYRFSQRVSLSATWVYSTGAPVTLPIGRFEYEGQYVPVYGERNGHRLPDYHRLDLGATIKSRRSSQGGFYGEWTFSVYNAYYRKNTWMLDFRASEEEPSRIDAYKVYLFPILPSVTYNFYF